MADQLTQLRAGQYQQLPPQPGGQSMVWVSGEAEAMAYLVAPNSAVALWDSSSPTIYLKQADASGKPSMKIYDLVERPVQATQAPAVEYAPLSRLEALEARLDALAATNTEKEGAE